MFVNQAFAQKHKLKTHPLPNPVPVHNVNGTPNENGSIMEEVEVILWYGQHMEKACLTVANLGWQTVTIGHSWLTHHNPEADWAEHYIRAMDTPSQRLAQEVQKAEESQLPKNMVPAQYHNFRDVFSKEA